MLCIFGFLIPSTFKKKKVTNQVAILRNISNTFTEKNHINYPSETSVVRRTPLRSIELFISPTNDLVLSSSPHVTGTPCLSDTPHTSCPSSSCPCFVQIITSVVLFLNGNICFDLGFLAALWEYHIPLVSDHFTDTGPC